MTVEEAIRNIDEVLSSDIHYDETLEYRLTSFDFEWLEKAKQALEKQIPKAPIQNRKERIRYTSAYSCPCCGHGFAGTGMTAKEYLSQYRSLNDSINAKLEQVGELRRKAQTVSSGSSDGSGMHSSTPYDRIGEITARIVDLEREINEDIDRSIDLQREIRAAIATVPEVRLRTLLEYKYINLLTLDETAVRMNYSYPQICRLHGRALQHVKMIWNDS